MDRQTVNLFKQADRLYKQTGKYTGYINRKAVRQTGRINRQTNKQTDRQSNKQTDRKSISTDRPGLPGADLLLAAGQDAGDAVGLGDQGGVAHGGGQADQEALQVAGEHGGPSDQREGADVAHEDACQDDVAQLPAGGLDHGRVSIQDEDEGDEGGDENADAGEGHRHHGFHVGPVQVFQRQRLADCIGEDGDFSFSRIVFWTCVFKTVG